MSGPSRRGMRVGPTVAIDPDGLAAYIFPCAVRRAPSRVAVPGVVGGAPVRSVLAGTAAGALTALAPWVSAKSFRRRESASDHAFILDRSFATLDRDPPVAIGRLRDAGLAPVFVVDEIDKVPDPEALIWDVIGRLKHMATDHGFFCSVTDLGYHEGPRMRLREGSVLSVRA